jgi:hypothetical protein
VFGVFLTQARSSYKKNWFIKWADLKAQVAHPYFNPSEGQPILVAHPELKKNNNNNKNWALVGFRI